MRKLLAILLLMLLLFNLYGYRAWFYYLQQESQQQLAAVIDKDTYDESELITVKVPLSLPYVTSWNDFEKYDGNIEIDGQHYSYVKRKVQNDTLVLLCLPNKEQNKLAGNQKKFEGNINNYHNTDGSKSNSTLLLAKLLSADYDGNSMLLCPLTAPVAHSPKHVTTYSVLYYFYSITSPWQPPDIIG